MSLAGIYFFSAKRILFGIILHFINTSSFELISVEGFFVVFRIFMEISETLPLCEIDDYLLGGDVF